MAIKEVIEQEKVTPAQVKQAVAAPLIYVGPSTKKLQRFTVFQNGLPLEVKQYSKDCPAIEALFVPVQKLNEVQANLQDSASAESIFYAKANEYLKGVK